MRVAIVKTFLTIFILLSIVGITVFGATILDNYISKSNSATVKELPVVTESTEKTIETTKQKETTEPPETEKQTEVTTEQPTTIKTTKATKPKETKKVMKSTEPIESPENEVLYSAFYFKRMGVINWDGWRWTWYSERVLPGDGLDIPGRHADSDGYICDGDDYMCLSSSVLSKGTIISTPFGKSGKVYDCGCANDTIDVYVNW